MKKNFDENPEAMVMEMIRFLQDWGLWDYVRIFAGGKLYTDDLGSSYQGTAGVYCEEDVDPEEYMKGLTLADGEGNLEWKSLANPEHLFDMIFEGPLTMLLCYDEYAPNRGEISERCWKYIEENTDLISDYILDKYEISSEEELALRMWEELFENPELSYWDPLEFDTWEEYQELLYDVAEENPMAALHFDTYEEYQKARDGGPAYFKSERSEEIHMRWQKMIEEAEEEIRYEEGALPNQIRNHVYGEFEKIIGKYGLYHDYCFTWSLSCFRNEF